MKKTIGVIFGGRSVEHDVSIITAHNPIIDTLLTLPEYDVIPIYIAKDGVWYSTKEMNDIDFFRTDLDHKIKKLNRIQLDINDGFRVVIPRAFKNEEIKIDIVFPAMHGTYGEDGSLMGILRMANVPFVGCDLSASAVAMDKVLTKQVLKAEGLKVVEDVWFGKNEYIENKDYFEKKIEALGYPLFVKPVHLGSSIGINKAKDTQELQNAIEVALHYDDKILVEKAVQNLIEVTLPIMGNDKPVTAEVERPLNKTEFFDYNDKYMNSGKKGGGVNNNYSEIPANIDKRLIDEVKEMGIRAYKVLGCSGIARVDYLIDARENRVYINEVNTLPGSLYQHNWKKSGVSNVDLINKLIYYAEERFAASEASNKTFSSEILSSYGGKKIG